MIHEIGFCLAPREASLFDNVGDGTLFSYIYSIRGKPQLSL